MEIWIDFLLFRVDFKWNCWFQDSNVGNAKGVTQSHKGNKCLKLFYFFLTNYLFYILEVMFIFQRDIEMLTVFLPYIVWTFFGI